MAHPNPVLDAIFTRRSVRDYTDKKIDAATEELLIKAALAAPSASNKQPVNIVVVKNPALITELEQAIIAFFTKIGDTPTVDRIKSRGSKIFYDAPVSFFLAVKDKSELDVGIMAENIHIAATGLGLGSIILGLPGVAFNDPTTSDYWKKKLGFPAGYEWGIAVAVGFNAGGGKPPHEIDMGKVSYIN